MPITTTQMQKQHAQQGCARGPRRAEVEATTRQRGEDAQATLPGGDGPELNL